MASMQRTIENEVSLSGVGLFGGEPVTIRCRPAPPDHGVVFVRTDISGSPAVPASVEAVPARARYTFLRQRAAEVRVVEHLLAALAGLGIDNMVVEIDAPEMPVADGSARCFVDLFQKAGIVSQKATRAPFVVTLPMSATDGDATLVALPHDRGLLISYTLDYGDRFVRSQSFTVEVTEENFIEQIAPARTYVLRPEIEGFLAQGLGKGATEDNLLVLEEDGGYTGKPRFPDECARHKILDLIGDLFLAQAQLQARVVGYRSGHATNATLARAVHEAHRLQLGHEPPAAGALLDIRRIRQLLPHRYPFLLVDRVLEIEENKRAVGLKNVTYNEPFFQGHWPDDPVMPGVLLLEAMAQLAGVMLLGGLEMTDRVAMVASMERVKLRRPVVPGDQLMLEARLLKLKGRAAEVQTRGSVDGRVVSEARIRFMLVNRPSA